MLVYGITDEQAFALVRWRSQEKNTKVRALASQLVAELGTLISVPAALRAEVDHLVLTVHERIPAAPNGSERNGVAVDCAPAAP